MAIAGSLNACGGAGEPGGVSGVSCATGATTTADLAWDAVTATNLSGYRIYYGTSPGVYLQPPVVEVGGNVTTAQVTGLSSGTTYYFVVTAYDGINESGFSNEVCKTIS